MKDQFSEKLLFLSVIAVSLIFISSFYFNHQPEKAIPFSLTPPPTFDKGTLLRVELIDDGVIDMNGIGDDWSFASYLEDELLDNNKPIEINLDGLEFVEIFSIAVEDDPKHDDRGEESFKITPENLSDLLENEFYLAEVGVYECCGSGAGNTARCEFTYRITADYPEDKPSKNEIAEK